MKKLSVLFLGIIILATAVFACSPTCTDTDGGKVYDVMGLASGLCNLPKPDYCKNGPFTDVLKEGYCSGSSTAYEEVSCSQKFGINSVCIAGTCREFTYCRLTRPIDVNFCNTFCSSEEISACLSLIGQDYRCITIPKDICLRAGGTPYETRDSCKNEIPEFSGIASGLALAGAGAGFLILRKRR